MLGAAHFPAVEFFDFEVVALEVLEHFMKLAAELADVVVALREHYPGGEVAAAHAGDGSHEVFEGALHEHEQDREKNEAEENGEADACYEDNLCFVKAKGFQYGGDGDDAEEQHRDNRNDYFPLPADSGGPSHDGG